MDCNETFGFKLVFFLPCCFGPDGSLTLFFLLSSLAAPAD